MSTPTQRLGTWPAIAAGTALLFPVGVLSLALSPEGSVATWWPAAGLATALLTVVPVDRRPAAAAGVVVGTAAANLAYGRPWDNAVLFGVCNALEALTVAWLYRGTAARVPRLDDLGALVRLCLSAAAGALVIALTAGAIVAWDGADFTASVRSLLASHLAASLVILPAVLGLDAPARRPSRTEAVVQALFLAISLAVVFVPEDRISPSTLALPALSWAAFRFGLRTVSWQLVLVALVTSVATAAGQGPFANDPTTVEPTLAGGLGQVFLATAVLVCLPLAVLADQSVRLTDRLRATSELFRRNFSESLLAMLVLRHEEGRLVVHDANATAGRLLDSHPDALVGRPLDTLVRTDAPAADAVGALVDRPAGSWRDEGTLRGRPGSRVALSIAPLSGDAPGELYSAQLLDLTSEREAQAGLAEARQLSDITLETTAGLILVLDTDGVVLRVNPAVTRLTETLEDELVGRPVWETVLVADESRDASERAFAPHDFSGLPRSAESTVVSSQGREHRVAWTSGVVARSDGTPQYVVLTGLDVTAERSSAGLVRHLLQAAITTGIIGVDPQGRVTLVNTGARAVLSLDDDSDVVGSPFIDLFDPEELAGWAERRRVPPTFEALVAEAVDRPPLDWTWSHGSGQSTVVSLAMTRVEDYRGQQIGYLAVATDVTESRHNQELLMAALDTEREAVERLRALDAAKDEFVSTVSHELRTPVSSIVGYTELLEDGDLGDVVPAQAPALSAIARNGERLISLVDNLLTLSGLSSGNFSWSRQRVDLREVAEECRETVQSWVAGRELDVAFDLATEPVLVEGDPVQLRRMLANLLSNAVKFTEDGGHVRCSVTGEGDSTVLTVSDDGLGMHPEELERVFERFWRGESSQRRQIQGTGLGMPIVHAIATAHGGSVNVESAHQRGTTVTVRLPRHTGRARRTTTTL